MKGIKYQGHRTNNETNNEANNEAKPLTPLSKAMTPAPPLRPVEGVSTLWPVSKALAAIKGPGAIEPGEQRIGRRPTM